MIAHLGTGAFLAKSRNVVLLGPPRTGKTHLAIGLAAQAAHNAGRLPIELAKPRRIGLLVVDEVGDIPFEQDAANLFFQPVSSRYEHASLILTSARWGDAFGDQVVAAAMIDRIVDHADVLTLKGSSYRTQKTQESTRCPSPQPTTRRNNHEPRGLLFNRRPWPTFGPSSTPLARGSSNPPKPTSWTSTLRLSKALRSGATRGDDVIQMLLPPPWRPERFH